MNHLQPNVIALLWFTLLWGVCCLGFLQLTGLYPIRPRAGGLARNSTALVLGNTMLWRASLAGTLAFAYAELRWTTTLVVASLLFLFIPELFQIIPGRWRDGRVGMAIAGCIFAATLGLLAYLLASPMRWSDA